MISSKDFEQVIIGFRTACLQRFPDDINTLTAKERDDRLGVPSSRDLSNLLAGVITGPLDHIMRLVKTPRLLKTILRRTLHSWERLHGEIDFDDLLVANVIRFAAPEAYDFLLENYREIRALETEGVREDKKERKKLLRIKWDNITKAVSWDVTAGEGLLAFLFPVWVTEFFTSQKVVHQGVIGSEPTDYWIRLNVEELGDLEIRDQETLHALIDWKKDPKIKHFRGLILPEALCENEELPRKCEQFAQLVLSGQDLRGLASSLFVAMINKFGVKANADSCSGFLSLWRLATRAPIEEQEHANWILNEIRVALPKSLRFANDLYYYWRSNSQSEIYEKKPYQELRGRIIEEAKSLFQDSPQRLIQSLDPDFMYCLSHFVVVYSLEWGHGPGFHPEDWRWLTHLLVDAARLAPKVIIPQVVPLFVKVEGPIHNFICTFDKKMALELFGDRLIDIMNLMVEPLDLSRFKEQEKKMIEFARQEALRFVKTPETKI